MGPANTFLKGQICLHIWHTQSSIRDIGYESVFVIAFTLRKSVQNRYEPSGLGTRIQGELHELLLCSIKSCSNM